MVYKNYKEVNKYHLFFIYFKEFILIFDHKTIQNESD